MINERFKVIERYKNKFLRVIDTSEACISPTRPQSFLSRAPKLEFKSWFITSLKSVGYLKSNTDIKIKFDVSVIDLTCLY